MGYRIVSHAVRPILLATALTLVACSTPKAPPAPAPMASAPKPAPVAPRCDAGAPDQPGDVRDKMRTLGGDVQRCFLLGAATKKDTGRTIRTELTISDNGKIKRLDMTSPGADSSALDCARTSAQKVQFASFCGDDVTVQWSYTAQR